MKKLSSYHLLSSDAGKAFVPSRGIRNNNPLNIRRLVTNDWLGKITDSVATDMEFEQFRHPKYGFRAAFILLHRYISQGYKSVRDIITRWAPASDGNHVENYIRCVCVEVGLRECQEIRKSSYSDMSRLIEGMFFVENGVRMSGLSNKTYWYQSLSDGYDLYIDRFVN